MKPIVLLTGAIVGLLAFSWGGKTATIQTVQSVAALRSANFGSVRTLILRGFYPGSHSGGGTLIAVPNNTKVDSCVIYADAAGHHFQRILNEKPINVAMCGARCTGMQIADGRSTGGSPLITSAEARWTPAMVGWRAVVNKAGSSGRQIDTTVVAVFGAHSLALAVSAGTTGSGETVSIYPDDTAALDDAIAAASKAKIAVELPARAICGYANPGRSVFKQIAAPGLLLNSGTLWLGQTGPGIDDGVGLQFSANGSKIVGPGTISGLYQTDQGSPQLNTAAALFSGTIGSSITGHVTIENTKGRAFLADRVKNFTVTDVVVRDCGDFVYQHTPVVDDQLGRSMCGQVTAPSGTLTISNYTGNNASQAGLLVYGPTDTAFRAAISNCHFSGNGYYGLDLEEISGSITLSNCEQRGNGKTPSGAILYGGYIARDVARLSAVNVSSSLIDSNAFVIESVDSQANMLDWSIDGLTVSGTPDRHGAAIYIALTWQGKPQRVALSDVSYDSLTLYANSPGCSTVAPRQQLLTFDKLRASRLYTAGPQTVFSPQGNPGQIMYVYGRNSDLGTFSMKPLGANQDAMFFDMSGVMVNGAIANSPSPFRCP